jgi:hypothetical protein
MENFGISWCGRSRPVPQTNENLDEFVDRMTQTILDRHDSIVLRISPLVWEVSNHWQNTLLTEHLILRGVSAPYSGDYGANQVLEISDKRMHG